MLFYSKMRWELKGMSFDQLWDLEGKEADAGVQSIQQGFIKHLYKVASEQYVISIGESNTIEEFDQYSMGVLPMREHLVFEEVWTLDEGFTIDVASYLNERRPGIKSDPRYLYYMELSWPADRRNLDDDWKKIIQVLQGTYTFKILGAYRVAAQQKIILIVDVRSAEELNSISGLDFLRAAEVVKVWALRDYEGFAVDVKKHYKFEDK
jgi:muconolactone D-isomerase